MPSWQKMIVMSLMALALSITSAVAAPAYIFDSNGNPITAVAGALNVNGSFVQNGNSPAAHVRNAYGTTPVTTAAYVQILASTPSVINAIEVFDSSGQTLVLAEGAPGSEVDQVFIFPGGNGRIPFAIASGVRLSVKAVTATASAGELDVNLYQ